MDDNSCDGFAVPGGSSDSESSIIRIATESAVEGTGRSVIWQYFAKIDASTAQCKSCLTILKIPSSTTTTLWRHLRIHQSSITPKPVEKNIEPLDANSTRAKDLTTAIAQMIIWDLEPYSLVDHRGFRALLSVVEPRYVVPSRTTFSRDIIPNLYLKEVERVKQIILRDIEEGVSTVAFTTDGWTSRAIDSYVSLTVHYVTKKFEPRRFTLAMTHITESHTSKNLYDILQAIIDEWGLDNACIKSKFFITDNAANIVAAIRLGNGWTRVACFAHTLQLAVKDAVKDISEFETICRKAQKIVSYFARSTSGHAKLFQAQENLSPEKKPLKLIQNVDTRWNSQHDMMARLITLRKALSVVLCDRGMPSNLNESEWAAVETYVDILSPVKEATVLMSSDTYPTLSQYMPVIEMLKKASDPSQFENSDGMDVDSEEVSTSAANLFAKSLSTALNHRFSYVNANNDHLAFSTILDPRFKDRFLTKPSDKLAVTKRLKERAALEFSASPDSARDNVHSNRSDKEGQPRSKLSRLFDEFLGAEDLNGDNDVDRELVRYLQENVQPRSMSVLHWWSENQTRFPVLAHLARQYLNIPASQTTSERLFSTAGSIVTPSRAQLLTRHVEQIAFLHENYSGH